MTTATQTTRQQHNKNPPKTATHPRNRRPKELVPTERTRHGQEATAEHRVLLHDEVTNDAVHCPATTTTSTAHAQHRATSTQRCCAAGRHASPTIASQPGAPRAVPPMKLSGHGRSNTVPRQFVEYTSLTVRHRDSDAHHAHSSTDAQLVQSP